jgi:mono/diheme cytochrome c family protein/predicted small secreted protein
MSTKFGFKRFAALLAVVVIGVLVLAACASGTPASGTGVPQPSNGGGTGPAVGMTGDATAGATVFTANCAKCHGDQGKGGVANPGSDDGTIPAINPIDPGLANADPKVFATNIDPFIEHGSTPDGTAPALKMAAFGDDKTLTPQQIADVMAYVISLNPAK